MRVFALIIKPGRAILFCKEVSINIYTDITTLNPNSENYTYYNLS